MAVQQTASDKPKVFKILEKTWLWYTLSLAVIVAGLLAIVFNGLNVGIDFTGGTNLMVRFSEQVQLADVRSELQKFGIEKYTVQKIGQESTNTFLVRMTELDQAKRTALLDQIGRNLTGMEILEVDSIGPAIGDELKSQSVWIVLIVLLSLLVYITFRFEFWSGLAAILALAHDAFTTIGFIALFRLEIDLAVVVAILTILGYSINDTIVIFDRVRENLNIFKKGMTFHDLVNLSLTQTMSRSINTTMTVLLAILCLIIFGGATIKTFALVLFFGIATGAYSSIFIASPLLASFKKIKI
ncbi:MAG: protein translocase subunit SecF [Candidatus Margulisiibacteriota bacterium]|jgi:preprotein translocase subunit SecF